MHQHTIPETDGSLDSSKETRGNRLHMELRRGVLTLAVLAALRREEYGYSLRKKLHNAGIDIEEGTLYPLVRRLESQGLLQSEWRDTEGRNKRYYKISAEGADILDELRRDWTEMVASLGNLLENE
jgi:PadR family transcriptional regulator PadR